MSFLKRPPNMSCQFTKAFSLAASQRQQSPDSHMDSVQVGIMFRYGISNLYMRKRSESASIPYERNSLFAIPINLGLKLGLFGNQIRIIFTFYILYRVNHWTEWLDQFASIGNTALESPMLNVQGHKKYIVSSLHETE